MGERAGFLRSACAGDEHLCGEVAALLEAADRSVEYFDKLPERLGVANLISGDPEAEADFSAGAPAPLAGEPGQQFGQYVLTELVGTGGMGSVWRASRSDGRYEGEVAVKVLAGTSGLAGSERFALEGRYLAKLTHPNIARLLDAGVGLGGVPYLVLEFVNGRAIDQYCDVNALTLEQRIVLFLQVLDAVANAHTHLLVHRDIKPSNVQVTTDGAVKLLDFGVAKLLTDESVRQHELTHQVGAA